MCLQGPLVEIDGEDDTISSCLKPVTKASRAREQIDRERPLRLREPSPIRTLVGGGWMHWQSERGRPTHRDAYPWMHSCARFSVEG